MNKIFTNLQASDLLREVIPSFGISLLIAEVYYKLGSFTIECLAFLGTWYATGIIINKIHSFISDKIKN